MLVNRIRAFNSSNSYLNSLDLNSLDTLVCGIAGFVSKPQVADGFARDVVLRMTNRMLSRGPDAEGLWAGDGITLGHRRLAILDLDARANQPMVSTDGRYTIVFNGEIYNFGELRRSLEEKGMVFMTTSDTEVLLALFESEGERMLPKLRGMFAFAVWDRETSELFLARDPYGIKPLYYTQTPDGMLFASQVRAILASGRVSFEQEPAGLAGFFLWGSVPEPWTLYRNVFALPAGHWLRVCGAAVKSAVCWHDIRTHWHAGTGEVAICRPREVPPDRSAASPPARSRLHRHH